MSNQIVISSGAKVRSLEGVLTGTAGIVNALGINVANGIPQLDSNAKILVSQLPNSVMEYKGTWNAATNTPTLVNGTGNQGDVYLCNVAGTANFGAGAITFAVGDQVIYSGTIWQKAGGATGTVTSVALTETGDALTITGSPITTSGIINIGFAGTTGQYINGAGNLTTFPSFVSSVGLTTTSPALTITNSPITSSGNIGLNFAGTGSQYIKGDGTLATFPTTIDQAKRLITEVYNSTGATLTKGTVVYINGGQGNLPTVTKAQANSDATSAQTYGVVQSDITNMNNGFVVVFGSITDIDTQAYAVGTQLYLSGTTAGEWTSTKPSAPIHLVYVGIVVRSHPTQGVVEIRIQNGYELEELHDVAISAPVNNQGIFYNSSNDLWENKSIATALGYTPANDSLVVHLAGTETITGAKTFNALLKAVQINIDNSTLSEATPLSFKQYSSGTLGSTGFTSLSAIGANQFNINFGGTKTAIFDATNLTANRTYNFPDASGTIALTSDIPDLSGYVTLATSQTISGAKTFSNNVRIDNGSASAFLAFKQYSSGSTGTAGFTSIYAINTDTFGISYGAGNDILFKTASPTLPRTYTFPNNSGTVALTSDIPSLTGYVPYTGATSSVNLGIYGFTAASIYVAASGSNAGQIQLKQGNTFTTPNGYGTFGSGDVNNFYFYQNSSSVVRGAILSLAYITGGATRTYNLPDADGTIALTSNLSSYLPLTGGTLTGGLYINPTNTGVIGLDVASNNTSFRSDNLEGSKRQLLMTMGSGTLIQLTAKGYEAARPTDLAFYTSTSGGVNASPTIYMTGGGNVGIGTGSPSGILQVQNVQDGISGKNLTLAYNGTYYAEFTEKSIRAYNNELIIGTGTGGAERMRINSTGQVGIGTSSFTGFNSTDLVLRVQQSSGISAVQAISGDSGAGVWLYSGANSSDFPSIIFKRDLRFGSATDLGTGGYSERMRITSGGDVQVQGTNSNAKIILFRNYSNSQPGISVYNTSNTEVMYFNGNTGGLGITGPLSKGSGSFKIDHPIESMKDTHYLVHSFVESPQANNIYRGKVQLIDGKALINLDEVSTMTEGTFILLNREIHTYTSNETDWDAVRGKVDGNILTIECQNNQSNAIVSWLVIGERQDKHMYDTEWTDENGKVIVEPLKEVTALENK